MVTLMLLMFGAAYTQDLGNTTTVDPSVSLTDTYCDILSNLVLQSYFVVQNTFCNVLTETTPSQANKFCKIMISKHL